VGAAFTEEAGMAAGIDEGGFDYLVHSERPGR
jgi:hypothetical protein